MSQAQRYSAAAVFIKLFFHLICKCNLTSSHSMLAEKLNDGTTPVKMSDASKKMKAGHPGSVQNLYRKKKKLHISAALEDLS